jgi:hypothetical protein
MMKLVQLNLRCLRNYLMKRKNNKNRSQEAIRRTIEKIIKISKEIREMTAKSSIQKHIKRDLIKTPREMKKRRKAPNSIGIKQKLQQKANPLLFPRKKIGSPDLTLWTGTKN